MLTKTILAAGALLSMAAAIPMQAQNKRDVVWETKIEEEVVTVDVTTTIWLNPGETPPVVPVGGGEKPGHYGHGNHGKHHNKITSHIKSTITVPAPSEQPTEPAPAPETTSTYVAPAPTTSTWVAPTSSTPAPVESTPAATPPAYSSSAPAPAPSSGGSSAPSGQTYTGDVTYYTPGMGSCGIVNTDSDAIVALAEGMMSAMTPASGNPNLNPLCGKSITISYGGKTATAKIMDTCPGCAGGGLDLTPSLFEVFAPLGEGRLTGMKWWYN